MKRWPFSAQVIFNKEIGHQQKNVWWKHEDIHRIRVVQLVAIAVRDGVNDYA